MTTLKQKITSKTAVIGVIGLGHTGLPLALAFVEAGFPVYGIEIDKGKVKDLQNRRSYDLDVSSETIARIMDTGRFFLHSQRQLPGNLDCIVFSVPTPLNKTKDPDISYILDVVRYTEKVLRKEMLIVLQSTTYPGTTRELVLPMLEKTGLKAGRDFYLSYSPERLDPGNAQYTTHNIPRIAGGITKKCTEMTVLLFRAVVDTVIPVSSAETAEMTKLLENTFRSVNIALINEVAIMCDKLNINVWEVIEAARTKPFGFMPFFPGPGIGGHCIPVDPQYLSWKLRLLNYRARFIELASEVNAEMPEFVVKKIADILNQQGMAVKNARIALLGMAYKRDSNDYRESPSIDIYGMLKAMGARLTCCDPHIDILEVSNTTIKTAAVTQKMLKNQDIAVILTDHRTFDYELIKTCAPLIFDTRNVYGKNEGKHIFTL